MHDCYGNCMVTMKTKELRDNCLFQHMVSNKKKGRLDLYFERNNLYVSAIYIVSYLHENGEFDHSFNPSWSLVFIIAKATYGGAHPPGISSSTHGMKLKLTTEMLLDKRCWLMTLSLWSHDPCVVYRPEIIFADITKNWKIASSVKFSCLSDLPVITSSWYHL